MSRGILTVVSGFSGAGKGTVMNGLLAKYDNYALSVSATTRRPREGEQDGREYFFKTKDAFERMIAEDAFIEYAKYVENYYGTPKVYVEEQLSRGKDVLLEIEIQGALQVKEKCPDALLVFITPPNAEILEQRLTGRGTETPEVIAQRMNRAAEESEGMGAYDYIIVNDRLDDCIEEMHRVIQSRHAAVTEKRDFIREIQKELKQRKERRANHDTSIL